MTRLSRHIRTLEYTFHDENVHTSRHTRSQGVKTRLLGRPQPQMYPPVALNQYTWVNRTHKHFLYMFQHVQGPMQILK